MIKMRERERMKEGKKKKRAIVWMKKALPPLKLLGVAERGVCCMGYSTFPHNYSMGVVERGYKHSSLPPI